MNEDGAPKTDRSTETPPPSIPKTAVGGVLMGVANLIPGLSGGTMILAMGLYTEFIDSVADVTALRFSRRRLIFLGVVGVFALGSIAGLAGVILYLLFHYSAAMYALFIGMTLGGAPLLAKSLKPMRADAAVAILAGLGLMFGVFVLRQGATLPHNMAMDFASGVVGSTTMVLPGISGSYMLLVMDQYDRIVGVIEDLKNGLRARDLALIKEALWIVVPVGIGVVLGIVALSNILKWLLHRFERVTIGFLLGLLVGSVFGLWPFGRAPSEKAIERRSAAELASFAARHGIETDPESDHEVLAALLAEQWDDRSVSDFAVSTVAIVAVMLAAGFATTYTLAQRGESLSRDAT